MGLDWTLPIIERRAETWFSEITAGALGFTIRDVDDYEIVAVAAVSKSNLRSFAAVKDLAMLPPHIRSNIVSTPTRSEANLPQGEKLALKAWKALAQGDEAQSLGDRASGTNHFERAILDAEECIREFDARARDRERVLESASMPKPPLGDVSNADKMRMFAEGSLNGVATCYYIKGRSLERLGRYAEARDAYSNAMYFTYARTWDPRSDFFWSPSEFASDRLNFLKEQKIIP